MPRPDHRELDRLVVQVARTHHGAFSDTFVQSNGGTRRLIAYRIDVGQWIRLGYNALALPSNPPTFERQCMAATFTVRGSGIAFQSAGVLHRFEGLRPGRIHLAAPRGSSTRSSLAVVHRSDLTRLTRIGNIPVTTAEDTLIQLAGVMSSERLATMAGAAFVRHPELLGRLADRYVDLSRSRLPGLLAVHAVLDRFEDQVADESVLEVILDDVLAQVEPPLTIERQVSFPWRAHEAMRVDRFLPELGLIVEADGRAWHARYEAFERDRWRDNEATSRGIGVMRFTWLTLHHTPHVALEQLTRRGAGRLAA